MPAQAEAAFDRLVGRIDEIAFGRDVAGKGKAAGKDQRAAYEDVATCVFHHVFPESDHHALGDAGAVGFGKSRTRTCRQRRDFNLLSRFLGKIPDWVVCYLPRVMFRIQALFQLVKIA